MKKIPKSITVTVEREGNHVKIGNMVDSSSYKEMRRFKFFPRTKRYRVTYAQSPKGELIVRYTCVCTDVRPYGETFRNGEFVNTCFIPKSWAGHRVSRKVEPIRVKK